MPTVNELKTEKELLELQLAIKKLKEQLEKKEPYIRPQIGDLPWPTNPYPPMVPYPITPYEPLIGDYRYWKTIYWMTGGEY